MPNIIKERSITKYTPDTNIVNVYEMGTYRNGENKQIKCKLIKMAEGFSKKTYL